MASTSVKIAAGAGAAVALAIVAGFGPLVRSQAERSAARLGAEVTIDRVIPAWGGVVLQGVDVTAADVPAAAVHVDEVRVGVFGGRSVALRSGTVSLTGSRQEVLRQVEAWRAKHSSGGGASGEGGGTRLSFEGVSVAWQDRKEHPEETVVAREIQLAREAGSVRIQAASAKVVTARLALEVAKPHIALSKKDGEGYRVHELSAEGVEAAVELPGARPAETKGGAAAAHAEAEEDQAAGADVPEVAGPPGDDKASERGQRLRDALVRAALAVDGGLEKGARVHLSGVHARLQRGLDTLNLGPGALDVRRDGDRLEVELAPELSPPRVAGAAGASAEQAVTFHLSVPLSATPGEVVADVRGGPIGLATLGVREGDFGLFDVAKASLATRSHVVLSADGRSLTIDGEGKLHQLSLRSAALSDEPVAGLELAFRVKADLDLDGKRVKVDEAEIDLGAMRFAGRGSYEKVDGAHRVAGSYEMPLTACQSMFDSAPAGLVPRLKGMRFAGSFALKGTAHFDTANLDRSYKVDWEVANSCRVTEAPAEINVARFKHTFRRTVYTPEGKPTAIDAGPDTPEWVAGSRISKFMEVAVETTEDGGFPRHRGFDHEAIRNSIRENLRKMKFVRGASTISMQLAKNLYLDRTKNVSRKLQEAVLTMYLEQELTKEQILELYLNVVEFGPMIYGIGPAARYYFNSSASDLSVGQALYISSIMPNPKVQHFGAGGAVAQGWASYLHKLMHIAYDRHHLTDDELDEGLRETLIRGSPSQHSPRGSHTDEPQGDPDWVAP